MRQLGLHEELVVSGGEPLPIGRRWRTDALAVRPPLPGHDPGHLRSAQTTHLRTGAIVTGARGAISVRAVQRSVRSRDVRPVDRAREFLRPALDSRGARREQRRGSHPTRAGGGVFADGVINAWYIKNPPWKQIDRDANNKGELAENWERLEQTCRSALELRMRFLPLIHAAFVRYHREGLPPFRALVMDYPDDPQTWAIDDQYVVGNDVIVAPVSAGHAQRSVYLPAGDWFDFWSGARYAGGRSITMDVPLEQVPLFARAGALLPLADVTTHTDDPGAWALTVLVCGDGSVATSIFEDDDGLPAGLTEVHLTWDVSTGRGTVERSREHRGRRYNLSAWRPLATRG